MPSSTAQGRSLFDKFASAIDQQVSRAPFFVFCVLLVVIWTPSLFLMPMDSSQLLINTPTTVITFLLVALQTNTNKRADAALQTKLNAIAAGLVDLMEDLDITGHARELRKAVGLEEKEST